MDNKNIIEKYIDKETFFEIIKKHIYLEKGIYFDVVPDVRIKETAFGETPDMTIYLEQVINNEKVRIPLTEEEIKNILTTYIESSKESLDSYLYSGGIHYMGHYNNQDYACFDGVYLYVRQKSLKERITKKCLQKR